MSLTTSQLAVAVSALSVVAVELNKPKYYADRLAFVNRQIRDAKLPRFTSAQRLLLTESNTKIGSTYQFGDTIIAIGDALPGPILFNPFEDSLYIFKRFAFGETPLNGGFPITPNDTAELVPYGQLPSKVNFGNYQDYYLVEVLYQGGSIDYT